MERNETHYQAEPSSDVVGPSTVTQGDGQRSNMVSHNSVGHVNLVLVLGTHFSGVWSRTGTLVQLFNFNTNKISHLLCEWL